MKKSNKNKILKYVISGFLMAFLLANFVYAAKLKKGVYKITNHREGRSQMIVDENGKMLLKSDPESTIGIAKDDVTGEDRLLYKTYVKMYENADYNDDDFGGYTRTYEGIINSSTELYDLTGKNLKFDKEFIAIINDMVIFNDGNCFNLTLNAKSKLNELVDGGGRYSFINATNYFVFNKTEDKKGDAECTYIYDTKLNFKKLVPGCKVSLKMKTIQNKTDRKYLILERKDKDTDFSYNILDSDLNVVFDEWLYDIDIVDDNVVRVYSSDENGKQAQKYYNVVTKEYIDEYSNSNQNDNIYLLEFSNDRSKLTSTITDKKKSIVLHDIEIKKGIGFQFNNKKYYYIYTTNGLNYIYNEKGDRVKILKDKTDKEYRIVYTDEKFLALLAHGKIMYVYDKDFSLKQNIAIARNCSVDKLYNGKYYAVHGSAGIEKIFDANFEKIVLEAKNITQVRMPNKTYLYASYSDNTSDILDENLKKVATIDSSLYGIQLLHDKIYVLRNNCNFIYTEFANDTESLITIYDLNFKVLAELEVKKHDEDKNDYYEDDDGFGYYNSATKIYGDYLIIRRPNSYSLYKVGTGYILKDFYYIGDLESDHFTYVNGFNYGFMDYDLNILSHYSVFDSFNNDKYGDFFFY